jgi:hypothetical protein
MIVQGGGPTAVFNTSLAAILDEAQMQPGIGEISTILLQSIAVD